MASKLSLKKERLAELTTDDLHRVHGGAPDISGLLCINSVNRPCPSMYEACTTAMSCGCQPTWNCA